MKMYLSSYKIGSEGEKLKAMFGDNKKIAVIGNAMDGVSEDERMMHVEGTMIDLAAIPLEPTEIDLREYFGKPEILKNILETFAGVWVRGGNTFVLRNAMKMSGFDEYILEKVADRDFVYGGYSAGICVLAPSLRGFELVDPVEQMPKNYGEVEWAGLNILDFTPVPHYKSDHPEAVAVEKVVAYLKRNKMPYKTIRDGEVIILERV